MRTINTLFALVLILALSSCAGRPYQFVELATNDEKEFAKEFITDKLKDPNSAIFSEIWVMGYLHTDGRSGKGICGFVNAKNSFGGYTGKKLFFINVHTNEFYIQGNRGPLISSWCEEYLPAVN